MWFLFCRFKETVWVNKRPPTGYLWCLHAWRCKFWTSWWLHSNLHHKTLQQIKYSNLTFYCNSQDTNLFVFFRQFYWTPIQSFCQEHFNIVYKYFEVIGSFVAPLYCLYFDTCCTLRLFSVLFMFWFLC